MSIRVPDVDDGDIPGSLRDMMTDVEYAVDRYNARRDEVQRRRGCDLYDSSGTVIPNGVQTTVDWLASSYDTDTFTDLVGFPARITLPRGVWWLYFNGIVVGAGALSDAHIRILGSVSGDICSTITPSSQATANASTDRLIATPGEFFVAQVYQNSGGNGSVIGAFGAVQVGSF